jgi:anti-anti-sigma regulatory factor
LPPSLRCCATGWLSAIDHEQPALFVVDLGTVAYLVGTALSAVRKRQREYSGDMIVTNASARLARLFRLTGLDEVIEVNGQDGHADEAELLDGRRNGRLDGSGSTVQ